MYPYKEFYVKNFDKLTHINIPRAIDIALQDSVLTVLGLKDMGKLRDKFEGEAYYSNSVLKIYSFLSCLHYFKQPFPVINSEFLKIFKPIVSYNNDIAVVVAFKYGSLPSMKKIEYKKPRIFVMQLSSHKYVIFGLARVEVLNNNDNYIETNSSLDSEFFAFDMLDKV